VLNSLGREENREHNGDMGTLDNICREKLSEIARLGELYGARDVQVLGSVAQDDCASARDVDLLVNMDQGRTLFDLAGFVADVQDLLGIRVEMVTLGGLRYLRDQLLAETVTS
jgi:hypothetical protein